MNKAQFGKFIAETRKQFGLTQQELADRLHVTDKAVSKWERGLSYPNVTLLEPLANALDLSVSELIDGRKDQPVDADQQVRSVIDIADATQKKMKKRTILTTVLLCLLVTVLIAGLAISLFAFKQTEIYAQVVGKQSDAGGWYIYVEYADDLLRLKCKDQQSYNSIKADNVQWYQLELQFNRFTCEGKLINSKEDKTMLGDPTGMSGSVIGVGSLLGVDDVLKEYVYVWDDPVRENGYLYCLRFYYDNHKKADQPDEVELLTVKCCREAVAEDYDGDGIVELFVLTNYRTQPYCIYDLQNGEIITNFTDDVPNEIK